MNDIILDFGNEIDFDFSDDRSVMFNSSALDDDFVIQLMEPENEESATTESNIGYQENEDEKEWNEIDGAIEVKDDQLNLAAVFKWNNNVDSRLYILSGKKMLEASTDAAVEVWKTPFKHCRPRAIKRWAHIFLEFGELPKYLQRVHAKKLSSMSDKDVKNKAIDYFRSKRPNQRTIVGLANHIRKMIVPEIMAIGPISQPLSSLSNTTIAEYVRYWIFEQKSNSKDAIFFDDHEREDAKEYRIQWTKKMIEWKTKTEEYPRNSEGETVQPVLQEDEKKITYEDLKQYLNNYVIPLFKHLHPDSTTLFNFDQNQNYRAFAKDALLASRMPSGETVFNPESQFAFRDGSFKDPIDGKTKTQSIYIMHRIDFRKFKSEFNRLKAQIVPKKRFPSDAALRLHLVKKMKFPDPDKHFKCTFQILLKREVIGKNCKPRKRCNEEHVSNSCCLE
ncbi:uncharacterized protein B0P05DRAFT_640774 [Gilbertella persicaria]|uniref:uncharacterized protein n=1 Tax=Gilbertella persicaria TaxID=101096 RepID=UPI00221F3141|nr:uncharacterized protein B0P05DRAFT_640774 [Gilbertella persicaria]KAI8059991.1 hypothetical protein B0P05DRAFT_640774 [Gilbertella persicaria]